MMSIKVRIFHKNINWRKISEPVSFANTTTEVFVNEGNDVILDCLPDGEPTPEVSWFFEDKLITGW